MHHQGTPYVSQAVMHHHDAMLEMTGTSEQQTCITNLVVFMTANLLQRVLLRRRCSCTCAETGCKQRHDWACCT